MGIDYDFADKTIAEVIFSGRAYEPKVLYERLAPIADADHFQIPWVWYGLALAAQDLKLDLEFLEYSARFCFSPRTQRSDFRVGKVSLLVRRVALLIERGEDFDRDRQEFFAQSPSQRDVDELRGLGVTDLDVKVNTFSADQSLTLGSEPSPLPSSPPPAAIGAPHFCAAPLPQPTLPTVEVVSNVQYLSYGEDTAALRPDGSMYRGLCRSETIKSIWAAQTEEPKRLGGRAVVLNDIFSLSNYCHWMCDWFPRLLIAREAIGPVDWVCARIAGKPFEIETLRDLAGIPEDRILLDRDTRWYSFDEVVTVDNLSVAGTHPLWRGNPDVLNLVRRTVLPEPSPIVGRRIYLSRADAGNRQVINETELAKMLQEFDVEVVNIGEMSVREQARLFSACELVIGVHGAGLANSMFMPAGGTLIELFHYQFGSSAYVTLARAAGHAYQFLSCDDVSGSDAPERNIVTSKVTRYQYSDIWVEIEPMRRALKGLYG